LNLDPETPRLFPPAPVDQTEDKNPYLNEMRAALKKPMASVQPIGRKLLQLKGWTLKLALVCHKNVLNFVSLVIYICLTTLMVFFWQTLTLYS
jgi:hypothetical protein